MHLLALLPLPVLAQTDEEELIAACGEEAGPVCTWLYEQWGNVPLAAFAGRVVPAILQIILIVVIAYLANRTLRRFIKRFTRGLREQGLQKLGALQSKAPLRETSPIDLVRANMRTETIGGVLRSIATFAIWTLAFVSVLGVVGINLGPLIAGAGIAGVALGFGAQNLVRDFLSGIFMLLEDQYGLGDIVDTGEAVGTVEAITLRITRLRDVQGVVWHVPNGQINRIGNFSQQWSRALLDISVAYDTNIEHASEVIKRVADGMWRDRRWGPLVLDEPEVWGVESFGPSEILIRLVVKTAPTRQFEVSRELRRRLKDGFDAEGIVIPFPQRTVWMHQIEGAEPSGDGGPPAHEPGGGRREPERPAPRRSS